MTPAERRILQLSLPCARRARRQWTHARFTGQLPPAVAAPFDVVADRREEWLALSELSAMRRVL